MKYLIFLVPLGICLFLAYNGKSCSKGCHGCGKCMNFSRGKGIRKEDPFDQSLKSEECRLE